MFEAIFSPISNRADWYQPFEIVNDDTGELVTDFSNTSIEAEVRESRCSTPAVRASLINGKIVDVGNGVLEIRIPRSDLTCLPPGSYEIGITFKREDFTTQFLIGVLPIVDGIVSR